MRTAHPPAIWVVAVAAAVAVAVAACAPSVPSAPGSAVPSITAGPSSSTGMVPSQIVTAAPSLAAGVSGGFTWHEVPMAQFGGVELTNIVVVPDGLLAIGASFGVAAPSTQPPGSPILWRSGDGLTWRRLPASAAFIGPGSLSIDSISSVTAGSASLLVAVGAANNGDMSAFDAAAWTSADGGVTWQRATVDGAGDAAMYDVTAGPHGYVAVGIDGHPSGGTQMIGSRGAAVWTSADGSHWSRVPTEQDFAGAYMGRVVRAGANLVATGADVPHGVGGAQPPIWHSIDGLRWTRTASANAVADSIEISATVWTGSAFLVVGGQELGDRSFAWASPDGVKWTRTELQLATSASSRVNLGDVAIVGSTMVMVGFDQTRNGATFDQYIAGTVADVWASPDGRVWQAIPSLPMFAQAFPSRAISGPAGLLVLVSTPAQSNTNSLWLATR